MTTMKPESRALERAELRVEPGPGGKDVIRGYAAVFRSPSVDLGGFKEVILPGAFDRGLADADVRALVNHDPSLLLGRNTAGTLRLAVDDRGLAVEIDPPGTYASDDLLKNIRLKNITGMSFRFYVAAGGDNWRNGPEGVLRELTDVEIDDVSVVTYPAYKATEVSVRSAEAARACARSYFRSDGWLLHSWARLRIAKADL